MKVNVTKVIKDFNGNAIKDGEADVIARPLLVNALTLLGQDDKELSGDDRFKRYKLAIKITDNDEVDLTSEEVSHIKGIVGKMFQPLIVGRLFDILEGNE